jgi:transcriptional regulator with XRE-family HTH domain
MATPTRAKKRLGSFLAQLRASAKISALTAAKELKTTDATVSRYESGHVLPVWATVRTLMVFYKASVEDENRGAELWEQAREEPTPVRLPAGTPKGFRRLVNAEREAKTERELAPCTIPGLLQTEPYARALVAAAHRFRDPASRLDSVVTTRFARQELLEGPDALALHAVIDEAAISRKIGDAPVMREQLAHLLAVGEQPNITIQVLEFDVGAYGTMSGSCIIIGYPEPEETPGVYLEYPAGGAWVDDEEDVSRFTTMFDDVSAQALSPAETSQLIRRRMRALAKQ